MAKADPGVSAQVVGKPTIYLLRMIVFILLALIIAAVLFVQIRDAFMANPGLNGLILFVLVLGIVYTFRMVLRLFREVNWVNHFRITQPGMELPYHPRLLAPMAALLREHSGSAISPATMRSLLDSLASRLDESRDISRYLIGLLVFLGLLGTFWGLLQTIGSVGDVIRNLNVRSAESATIFEELKVGLEAPLKGMGTAFSSSLFGLAGSLILGFLDLQAAQAQNRFYIDVEDWLSTITDIAVGEAVAEPASGGIRTDLAHLHQSMAQLQQAVAQMARRMPPAQAASSAQSAAGGKPADIAAPMEHLAQSISGLVKQIHEEQRIMREWASEQSRQQQHLHAKVDKLGRHLGLDEQER